MSDKEASISDVWRGIELGAADVLEKPLSLLKLRNIWQHVVRKVRVGKRAPPLSNSHQLQRNQQHRVNVVR